MPISVPQRPPDPSPAAARANQRGVQLHAQGRLEEAIAAFREGLAAQPEAVLLRANLGLVLAEAGDVHAALHEYETARAIVSDQPAVLSGLGSLYVRLGRFSDALGCYEQLLAQNPNDLNAHNAMYELEQIGGNIPQALEHQRHILEHQTLFSTIAPQERRRVLVLLAPGDWQANVPVDFLIDRQHTTVHKFYLLSLQQALSAQLPAADVVFMAIAESDENLEYLAMARALLRQLNLPFINDPAHVLLTNRVEMGKILNGTANLHVPQSYRMARVQLAQSSPLPYPVLVRPVGSHAGKNLARVADADELQSYLDSLDADEFFVMPFVDFASADGLYRKYRIIVVDGVPYPYHLAISPNWMIHYYNAPMRENQWMRDEERHFLENFDAVFPAPLQQAMREVATRLGLQYFGIDCSIDRESRLLLFEADPAMIVHAGDDPQLFGYKNPYAQRIFDAFQRLVDRARSR